VFVEFKIFFSITKASKGREISLVSLQLSECVQNFSHFSSKILMMPLVLINIVDHSFFLNYCPLMFNGRQHLAVPLPPGMGKIEIFPLSAPLNSA